MSSFLRLTTFKVQVILLAVIALGFVVDLTYIGDRLSGTRSDPLAGRVGVLVGDAARQAVPGGSVKRFDADGAGRWQVGLMDPQGACWRVEVLYSGGAAAPVGERAAVGCWPVPGATDRGSSADPKIADGAKGFLTAYLSGGDISRFAKQGVTFLRPTTTGSLTDVGVTQNSDGSGGWFVTLTGRLTLTPPTTTTTSSSLLPSPSTSKPQSPPATAVPVGVQYRLHLVQADVGPVVDRVSAGIDPGSVTMGAPTTVTPSTTTTLLPTTTNPTKE